MTVAGGRNYGPDRRGIKNARVASSSHEASSVQERQSRKSSVRGAISDRTFTVVDQLEHYPEQIGTGWRWQ